MSTSISDTAQLVPPHLDWTVIAPGFQRRILADSQNMMAVQVSLAQGTVVAAHQHVHEQFTLVIGGELEFTLEGVTQVLKTGDSIMIASNLVHGVVATQDTLLLDMFSPPREDFRIK